MNMYQIKINGRVDIKDLNPMSPHQMSLIRNDPDATWISINTDQSGMVGLISRLHHLGLTLLMIQQTQDMKGLEKEDDV